jgi:triose/dihydroxyacetone kinase / FAD-AMP lyase (cyclizing)
MMITTCFVDEERLALLDSDTGAPAWPKTESNLMKGTFGRKGGSSGRVVSAPSSSLIGVSSKDIVIESKKGKQIINGIQAAANALIAEEEELTRMDRIVGDGDCGQTFKRGAEAILADLSTYDVEHPSVLCNQLGDSIRKSMGGSSGAILDIMFRAASTNFQDWPTALSNGVKSASFYGGAKVGYRTMLDALIPASEAALVLNSTLESIVVAAGKGAEGTKTMKPLAGRSSYIDQTSTNGTADPGAVAMAIALSAFSVGFKSDSNL